MLEKVLRRRWAQRPGLAKTRQVPPRPPNTETATLHLRMEVRRASPIRPPPFGFHDSALLDAAPLSIIGLFFIPICTPILETARRVRRGRPPPPLVWVFCRPLVQTNHVILPWLEEAFEEVVLFWVLEASERAAERVAGAFAVLDERVRPFLALRVVISFRIGDAPERLVRRRDRDRAQ